MFVFSFFVASQPHELEILYVPQCCPFYCGKSCKSLQKHSLGAINLTACFAARSRAANIDLTPCPAVGMPPSAVRVTAPWICICNAHGGVRVTSSFSHLSVFAPATFSRETRARALPQKLLINSRAERPGDTGCGRKHQADADKATKASLGLLMQNQWSARTKRRRLSPRPSCHLFSLINAQGLNSFSSVLRQFYQIFSADLMSFCRVRLSTVCLWMYTRRVLLSQREQSTCCSRKGFSAAEFRTFCAHRPFDKLLSLLFYWRKPHWFYCVSDY